MSVSSTHPHRYIQRHLSAHTEREIYSLDAGSRFESHQNPIALGGTSHKVKE